MRATDEIVRSALTWARNFEEINAPLFFNTDRPEKLVPEVLVFTNREALAFAYGCAVGGTAHGRSRFAHERWGWDEVAG